MTDIPDPGTPNPGSQEAVDLGCTCPRADNGYGRGVYTDGDGEPQFWIVVGCPVHDVWSRRDNALHPRD